MISKRKAISEFKKKVAVRDYFVAEGLESYPVRLYECVVHGYETGKGAYDLQPLFVSGCHYSEEEDKKSIKLLLEDAFKIKKRCYAQCGRKIRMTGVDFKLFREA